MQTRAGPVDRKVNGHSMPAQKAKAAPERQRSPLTGWKPAVPPSAVSPCLSSFRRRFWCCLAAAAGSVSSRRSPARSPSGSCSSNIAPAGCGAAAAAAAVLASHSAAAPASSASPAAATAATDAGTGCSAASGAMGGGAGAAAGFAAAAKKRGPRSSGSSSAASQPAVRSSRSRRFCWPASALVTAHGRRAHRGTALQGQNREVSCRAGGAAEELCTRAAVGGLARASRQVGGRGGGLGGRQAGREGSPRPGLRLVKLQTCPQTSLRGLGWQCTLVGRADVGDAAARHGVWLVVMPCAHNMPAAAVTGCAGSHAQDENTRVARRCAGSTAFGPPLCLATWQPPVQPWALPGDPSACSRASLAAGLLEFCLLMPPSGHLPVHVGMSGGNRSGGSPSCAW